MQRLHYQLRFKLRTALLVSLAICMALAWFSSARRQHLAVVAVQARGGAVYYGNNPFSDWLISWCPTSLDFVQRPKQVFFGGAVISDDDLTPIRQLDSLVMLNLARTKVSDEGIESLLQMTSLRYLDVTDSHVTEKGVAKRRDVMPHCQICCGAAEDE